MIHLVPLEQTVAGQELIQIGREENEKQLIEVKKQWQETEKQWKESEKQRQESEKQRQESEKQWKESEKQRLEEKKKMALSLKDKGMDVGFISETTGLSPKEIESL